MCFSVIADILTIVAFFITIWQLIVVHKRLKKVESETKRKYKATLDLIKIRDILGLIHAIQDDLTVSSLQELTTDRIRAIIIRMQYLNDFLMDTRDDKLINKYGRYDHQKLVSSVSSNISLLREASTDKNLCLDTRFICENLQNLRDSIKLIEIHLNNK